MTPGKLPHAQRLNVQTDDECRRKERQRTGEDTEEDREQCERKASRRERGRDREAERKESCSCLMTTPVHSYLSWIGLSFPHPPPAIVRSFLRFTFSLSFPLSSTSPLQRKGGWAPPGPLSVIAFLNSMFVACVVEQKSSRNKLETG